MGDGPDPLSAGKPRDDLQKPLVHEGPPSDHHDSNEDADDRVQVVEPDGEETKRAYIAEGRGSDHLTPEEDTDVRSDSESA